MKGFLVFALAGSLAVVSAQEEPSVPSDSSLVSINGCAKNGNFVVGERREDQPGTLEIAPGRRFRLAGAKKLLNDIKAHQRSVLQVTGLIRKSDLAGPGGIPLAGGRVRIGGTAMPDALGDPSRNPSYNQPTIDVRSWKELTGECK